MTELTAEDIASTARRAGWKITPERTAQIAASAAPRIAAFNRVRGSVTLDDEACLKLVLQETRYWEGNQS
jgi:hypothetical protein